MKAFRFLTIISFTVTIFLSFPLLSHARTIHDKYNNHMFANRNSVNRNLPKLHRKLISTNKMIQSRNYRPVNPSIIHNRLLNRASFIRRKR